MQNNWFKRMLFSYLPVLFVVSMSLLFLAYLALNEMSRQSAHNANELLSQSILQQVDNTLLDIDKQMQQLLIDNDIINIFFDVTSPPQDRQQLEYLAASELNDMMNQNEMISSVYLYRITDMTVVTPSDFIELEDFGDGHFIAHHINSLVPFVWTGPRSYRSRVDEPETNVISLIKYGDLARGSLMVVNVSVDKLTEMIRSMSQSNLNYIELVDQDGHLITTNLENQTNVSDNRNTLSHVQSSYTGWAIQSGIPQSGVVGWVSSLFYIWITFGFLVIFAGIVWLIYITYRNYKPIQGIMNQISTYTGSGNSLVQDNPKGDELQHIGSAIDYLFETSSKLQEQNKENLGYRKRQIFLNLLDGNENKKTSWKSELEMVGVQIQQQQLFVITVIEIDHYWRFSQRYNSKDQMLLKYILQSVVSETAENAEVQVWSEWINARQLGVMYIFDDVGAAASNEELQNLSETLREWVEQNLTYTVTIGAGEFIETLDQLSQSKEEALQAIAYKPSLGMNRFIFAKDIASFPQGDVYKQLSQIRRISQLYRTGDAKWKEEFNKMFHDIKQKLYTCDQLYELQNHLIYNLEREMKDLPDGLKAIWDKDVMNRLKQVQVEMEMVNETSEALEQILEEVFIDMKNKRERKSNFQLVNDVKYYIHANYKDPDLTLDQLSREFGLGSSYLSRLFKEAFGVNFSEYVLQIRMNEAKRLLVQTKDPVQDIAISVGYLRSLTFIRAFKKFTGETPGNYRIKSVK